MMDRQVQTQMDIHVYMHIMHVDVLMCLGMYIYMYIYTPMLPYVSIYICISLSLSLCICMYVCFYKHIDICANLVYERTATTSAAQTLPDLAEAELPLQQRRPLRLLPLVEAGAELHDEADVAGPEAENHGRGSVPAGSYHNLHKRTGWGLRGSLL